MNRSAFSGDPVTRWESDPSQGDRIMRLVGQFSYTDPHGFCWTVPDGASLNGATIPRALWSAIGAPFTGNYRLASIVHDYFVGEGDNPPVSSQERKKADRMFYEACLDGGCSARFASLLYIGVRFGSWISQETTPSRSLKDDTSVEFVRDDKGDEATRQLYWETVEAADAAIKQRDLDAIDRCLASRFGKTD